MEPAAGCLEAHARAHPRGTRRCVVGAAPIEPAADAPAAARYVAGKFNRHLQRISKPAHVFALRDFYSGNASIRREVLVEVDGFDEGFRAYGNEDLELSLRLRGAGVEIAFCAEALAWQHYDKDFRALGADTIAKGRTAVEFAARHPEAYADLQLATRDRGSRARRILRGVLLAAGRRSSLVPRAVLAAGAFLERRQPHRLAWYRHALDYLYWVGASGATRDHDLT
jgi:GT2 family glycosyltransferase